MSLKAIYIETSVIFLSESNSDQITNMFFQKTYLIALAAILLFAACQQSSSPKPADNNTTSLKDYFSYGETGIKSAGVRMIPVTTPSGTFNVWTKRIGNNPKIKVLLLHGGPGLTHEYLESFESFLPAEGIEMYYYDQLGSKYSGQSADTSLWRLDRFVEEVEQVRIALGLNKDNFYLLGQSWGGILALQYSLKYQQHLKGLIISNMMPNFPAYGRYNETLRKQLRPSLLDSLVAYEKANKYSDPTYVSLVNNEFYTKHICRLPYAQWPEPALRSFSNVNGQIYVQMQGPSEFVPGGNLKDWNVEPRLLEISVPTLSIGAKHDTMDPESMKNLAAKVKKGRFHFCPEGSHLCFWDDQAHYFPGLIQFLKDVDAGAF